MSKKLCSKRGCEHLEGISSNITAMSVLLSLFFFFKILVHMPFFKAQCSRISVCEVFSWNLGLGFLEGYLQGS